MRTNKCYTVSSESVQGEGSYISLKRITYGERRALIEEIAQSSDSNALFDRYIEKVGEYLLDWNWQDETGAPIPLGRFDLLMPEEIAFLLEAVGRLLRGELLLDAKN